jgi:hypothetical protein
MAKRRVVVLKTAGGARERDLLEDCEAAFNIDIEAPEAEALRTVGDLYSVIRWKCQYDHLGPPAPAIADAYRQLRAHLAGRRTGTPLRPTASLEALLGPDPRGEWAILRRRFGKGLPRLELSDGQLLVVAMLLALGLAGGVFGGLAVSDALAAPALGAGAGLMALGLALAAVMAYSLLLARSIPAGLRTVGDLARLMASRSQKNQGQPSALWLMLEDIIRRDGGIEGPVTADLGVELAKKASAR